MPPNGKAKSHDEPDAREVGSAVEANGSGLSPSGRQRERLQSALDKLRVALGELEAALCTRDADATVLMQQQALPAVEREVMKPREYAEHMRVDVRKVHGWIRRGMPHFLVEGRIRVRTAEADAWLVSERGGSRAGKRQGQHKKDGDGKAKAQKLKASGHGTKRSGCRSRGKAKRER
jgi:hypothetical protein